jgi:hypothetical protein
MNKEKYPNLGFKTDDRHKFCEFIKGIHSTNTKLGDPVSLNFQSQFYDDTIICYYGFDENEFRRNIHENSLDNLKKSYTRGNLQPKRRRQLTKILNLWFSLTLFAIKHNTVANKKLNIKLSFITLTLSYNQSHTDQEIKRHCLNSFLTSLRHEHTGINYFWKAEKQRNGNIHFHLIVDQYVNKYWLQNKWNKAQNNLLYIDQYTQASGKTNPPSTDIRLIHNAAMLNSYLVNYVLKEEDRDPVNGIVVGMSDTLRDLKPYVKTWTQFETSRLLQYLELYACSVFWHDHCTVVKFKNPNKFYTEFFEFRIERESHMTKQCIALWQDYYNHSPGKAARPPT